MGLLSGFNAFVQGKYGNIAWDLVSRCHRVVPQLQAPCTLCPLSILSTGLVLFYQWFYIYFLHISDISLTHNYISKELSSKAIFFWIMNEFRLPQTLVEYLPTSSNDKTIGCTQETFRDKIIILLDKSQQILTSESRTDMGTELGYWKYFVGARVQ